MKTNECNLNYINLLVMLINNFHQYYIILQKLFKIILLKNIFKNDKNSQLYYGF
jgi:replication initiation and membrane attachment protein DnaB